MKPNSELIAEIKDQLNDDILYFSWLKQLAKGYSPELNEAQTIEAVLDAVIFLHEENTIVVGDSKNIDGCVLIFPWKETKNKLRERMFSEIESANDRDRDFCFWIQLTEHWKR